MSMIQYNLNSRSRQFGRLEPKIAEGSRWGMKRDVRGKMWYFK